MGSERGQSTPFFLCFLVLMTVMVGTMVNVGQAINRRMALQVAADAGAWTGGTNMAIGMNALAEVNDWRRDIEPLISVVLPIAGLLGADEPVIKAWEFATTVLNLADGVIQIGYAKIPYDEAARVTWYNNQDLFPGEQLRWYEGFRSNVISDGSDTIGDEVPLMKSRPTACMEQPIFGTGQFPVLPCLVDEDPIDRTQPYAVPCIIGLCPKFYDYTRWYEKSGRQIGFVWIVEAPEAKAIFNPFDVFGDDAMPMMRAAAMAKPVGGNLLEGESEYRVKLVPLTRADMFLAPEAWLREEAYDSVFDKWRPLLY